MVLMISKEMSRWLNRSTVSESEKMKILDVPVDPQCLFGLAVEMMQKRCEEKKSKGEALQLCLPRKTQPSAFPVPCRTFAQAAAGQPPSTFKVEIGDVPAVDSPQGTNSMSAGVTSHSQPE
ncbi:hypothetical protein J4Q44_G00241210 [Coregonus suidteri]|uniref:Uncharacterized protein n=1 Tax=Coregonus suidteri TaxID=861788 RepID=A0AAN8LPJ4_9TELE